MSSSILDEYLNNLDRNRSFFTAKDLQDFERYRYDFDDAIKEAHLAPAFEIFRVYRQRISERIKYAINELEKDFNFSKDEHYLFDRSDSPWVQNTTELDILWGKRVKNDVLNLLLADEEIDTAREMLKKRYQRIESSVFQLNSNDVFQSFINAYTKTIEPHTAYFSPRASENFDISMRLSLEGIGAVLSTDNDYTLVQRIIKGGPADKSGLLHAKDRITGVGQGENGEIIDVIGWRLDDVVDLIRGPKDTVLRLKILPKSAGLDVPGKTITLTRNKIKLEDQAAQSSIIDIPSTGKHIGVIDIPTFYADFSAQAKGEKNFRSTSRDTKKLLTELLKQGVDGIIIDLRDNGGGSLPEALSLTGLFIEEGPIVQTKDASGQIVVNHDPDISLFYGGPLAVLVDRHSASASEIFAGAIQDYQRGIIVGEPTFGKGTVQSIVDLNRFIKSSDDHGKLKATIAQFFRISGGSTQNRGIIPDIEYPTVTDIEDYGERSLKNSLPWDSVKPTQYEKIGILEGPYDRVRLQHQARIKEDRAFQLLLSLIALERKSSNRKFVSLMEEKRRQEWDELRSMRHKLQNKLRSIKGLEPLPEEALYDDIVDNDLQKQKEQEQLDVILQETAMVLQDFINLTEDQPTIANSNNIENAVK